MSTQFLYFLTIKYCTVPKHSSEKVLILVQIHENLEIIENISIYPILVKISNREDYEKLISSNTVNIV